MSDEVIAAAALRKAFGPKQALDGLDLTVRAGEVHGFLGPNGAGKSTTIRILLGLVRADAGRVRVLGADPWRDAPRVHQRVAYVPGDVTLWPGMTGGQCLDLLAAVHGGLDPSRRAALLDRFELDPTVKARDYSKGNRQKVALVAAFAGRADLLVLDEPTSGLDPLMERVFQECVRERRDAGSSVLLSSHILAEVEALADRVTIVRAGRAVETGTLTQLRDRTSQAVDAITRVGPRGLEQIPGLDGLAITQVEDGVRTLFLVPVDGLDEAVGILHRAGIVHLTSSPPSLDALFLDRYRDEPEPTAERVRR